MKVERRENMVEVTIRYTNVPKVTKNCKADFFIYREIEVKGHAENTGYYNNIRVCASISAVTLGISRLVNENQYHLEHHRGYFHLWTDWSVNSEFKKCVDKDLVYAMNTITCQLYEIYRNYPNAFKKFDLIEEKEKIDYENKQTSPTKHKPFRKRRTMGLHSIEERVNLEENS